MTVEWSDGANPTPSSEQDESAPVNHVHPFPARFGPETTHVSGRRLVFPSCVGAAVKLPETMVTWKATGLEFGFCGYPKTGTCHPLP